MNKIIYSKVCFNLAFYLKKCKLNIHQSGDWILSQLPQAGDRVYPGQDASL